VALENGKATQNSINDDSIQLTYSIISTTHVWYQFISSSPWCILARIPLRLRQFI
jgi:hypothetical protein